MPPETDSLAGWHQRALVYAQVATAFIAIIGSSIGVVVYLTGGLKPQAQVVADGITEKINTLQKTTWEIQRVIESMPRPSDYAEITAHLFRVDGQIAANNASVSERLTRDEIAAAALTASVSSLSLGSSAPVRNSR